MFVRKGKQTRQIIHIREWMEVFCLYTYYTIATMEPKNSCVFTHYIRNFNYKYGDICFSFYAFYRNSIF